MTTQHTPGPWAFQHELDDEPTYIIGSNGNDVCELHPADFAGTLDQYRANARLIAAAPFLLETLEYIGRSTVDDTAAHLARNAIATAKGEA